MVDGSGVVGVDVDVGVIDGIVDGVGVIDGTVGVVDDVDAPSLASILGIVTLLCGYWANDDCMRRT